MNVSFQIETQKCQRHSEHLRKEIEVSCCTHTVPPAADQAHLTCRNGMGHSGSSYKHRATLITLGMAPYTSYLSQYPSLLFEPFFVQDDLGHNHHSSVTIVFKNTQSVITIQSSEHVTNNHHAIVDKTLGYLFS